MRALWMMLLMLASVLSTGCGYNRLQSNDEHVKASWSEVLNQYQRRAALVPNLVNTVQGYAAHETAVLTEVAAARASVGTIRATPGMVNEPQAFGHFQSAQGSLSNALSRLLAVSENYPQLKADASFRDLQAQLEGTEQRITVARKRYIGAVQEYNATVRSFPSNLTAMAFGYPVKVNFSVESERAISAAPYLIFAAQPAMAAEAK